MLGPPDAVRACLFDVGGVLAKTATGHAAAWRKMFDELPRAWSERNEVPVVPFDAHHDYDRYVDGRPGVLVTECCV